MGNFQPGWNFLALPQEFSSRDSAQVWVLPIPYEGTTSYGAGTRRGPAAIIEASRQVETYDRRRRCEPCCEYGIATLAPVEIDMTSPEAMTAVIRRTVADLYEDGGPRLLVTLGGEHTVSVGVVRGLADRNVLPADAVVVQIDAHADLRDTYENTPYSHACAARRMAELFPIFQIGIRNISEEGDRFRRDSGRIETVFADELSSRNYLDELAAFVAGKHVYLTIDLDGLDPSIMPAVGTPEPGGLTWDQTIAVCDVIARNAARVAGFDVVELAPLPGISGPDFIAAKLVYEAATRFVMDAASEDAGT
ncbi:MAG: agmatinase [Planctomycetota bacterium]|nr:MAG: agmatinase [Planctomycetota bacterium]